MSLPRVLVRCYDNDGRAYWLWGGRPVAVIAAYAHSEVLPALAEVERAVQTGLSAVGFLAYEAARGFDKAFPEAQARIPLVWFGFYEQLSVCPHLQPLSHSVGEGSGAFPLDLWERGQGGKGTTLQFKRNVSIQNFSASPPNPLSVHGEGEQTGREAGIPPSLRAERGDRGVRLRNGVGKLPGDVRFFEPTLCTLTRGGQGGEVKTQAKSPAILPKVEAESCTLIGEWQSTLSPSAYYCAVQRIRDYIEAGDVYQVNYSFRLQTTTRSDYSTLLSLFCQLYDAQPVPYAAYIDTGEQVILSLSPELFFALDGERIVSRPMKGTAPRGVTLEDDLKQALALRCSEKNRAENLMIVDMVRNDLGRIAAVGTVRVPKLFEVERYATLWQMTSTVEAQTCASLPEIFRALFPAASITGAPKIRATQIIHALENTPRGIYTGAIGVVSPDRQAQFNVAIRTLCYDRATQQLEYGVGSGVIWDSEHQAEYQECLTKAQVLLRPRPEFELLETLLWRAGRGYFLLEKHLQRLQRSAEYFGFAFDEATVRRLLRDAPRQHTTIEALRVARCRLLLNRRGEARVEMSPLEPKPKIWRVALAPEPIDLSDVFLYHKTTHRTVYERARAACPEYDDVILWNPRGEITESTIANVVARLEGKLYTPPVACGLLGGVYRQHLLERGKMQERIITIEELLKAEAVYLVNSVRGWVRAQLEEVDSPKIIETSGAVPLLREERDRA